MRIGRGLDEDWLRIAIFFCLICFLLFLHPLLAIENKFFLIICLNLSSSFRMTLNVKVGSFSIHSQDSISFMERLNPSDYVLSIMRHCLQFDLKETPPPYFEPNNQSCIQNLSVAQSQVEKWLKLGIVYEVKTRPYVCSPLTVSAKTGSLQRCPSNSTLVT